MKRRLLPAIVAVLTPAALPAQVAQYSMDRIVRPAELGAVPLYPPAETPAAAVPETWERTTAVFPDGTRHVDRMVRNVAVPTITPVLPSPAKATGAAVVVAPGGAFMALSIDAEGLDVARWLADRGIAAFVLKYRLNPSPADNQAFMAAIGARMTAAIRDGDAAAAIGEPHAYADALRALSLVRANAARWHVDPVRVGMIGFSAGAMTTLQAVLTGTPATRPAFVGYIYGPMTAVAVPGGAPPMFAALALDDPLFGRQGFGIVDAWRKAGGPVELHAYEHGDHGFGMGRAGTTSVLVMDEFRLWLNTNGLLGRHRDTKP